MSTFFDAYHKWLGIRPEEQPPNHYRLLGIAESESDPDVIRNAAERQIAYVRTYQLGDHLAECQEILNALAAARACLLSPEQKSAYDLRLRLSHARVSNTVGAPPRSNAPPPIRTNSVRHSSTPITAANLNWHSLKLGLIIAGSVAGGLLLGLLPFLMMPARGHRGEQIGERSTTGDRRTESIPAVRPRAPEMDLPQEARSERAGADSPSNEQGETSAPVESEMRVRPQTIGSGASQQPPAAPPLAVAPFSEQEASEYQARWAASRGVPVILTNSIGMKLALIPAGEFLMGSPDREKDRAYDEGPQHRVRITKPFHMGIYEVTQNEYEQVTGTSPSRFSSAAASDGRFTDMTTSRFPVENVSWDEAVEFCRKLSDLPAERSAGRVYRLPTEAEWEYACRAGTTTPFNFGSVLNGWGANCNGHFSYGTNQKGPNLERSTIVGSYQPNRFGLYDMHGNVSEWCADWYGSQSYAVSVTDDPAGPSFGGTRVVRGGSWLSMPDLSRSAYRGGFSRGDRYMTVGFRVVSRSALLDTPDSR